MNQIIRNPVGTGPWSAFPQRRLAWLGIGYLTLIWAFSIVVGLGCSNQLTYHEAFVAQGAREILASGDWWYPRIGGLPWLEKPPLPFWLVAASGWAAGEISPTVARLPSALAALGLVLGVGMLAAYRYGPVIAVLAGAMQATTAWTVLRGRLAEADILLACAITWAIVAFDRLRIREGQQDQGSACGKTSRAWQLWRWVFFGLLGITSFIKGTGFGCALVLCTVALVAIWDRDQTLRARLRFPAGWLLAGFLTVSWPLAMVRQHGLKVIGLWLLHVTSRLSTSATHGIIARESWSEYVLDILGQGLPWTPLALIGAIGLIPRVLAAPGRGRPGPADQERVNAALGDRLLWAWALGPLVLVSLASARNAHYAIHAMIPWSIWSAVEVSALGSWLCKRGWPRKRAARLVFGTLTGLAAAYGLGFWLVAPWFDHRSGEAAFYRQVGRQTPASEHLELLYDDWDREPYPTPFGPIPHDLALRLYYLDRPAGWHFHTESLMDCTSECPGDPERSGSDLSVNVIGRERDLPALRALGEVEVLQSSSGYRWDRTYLLAQIRSSRALASSARGDIQVSR
ncbi:MAG: ArnT family glycosyltransferase [Isosphaeraceae bacterium]